MPTLKHSCIIVANIRKQETLTCLANLRSYLSEKQISHILLSSYEPNLINELAIKYQKEIETSEFVISIGGDGTLLYTARLFAPYQKPVLGCNAGRFGFITCISQNELFSVLDDHLKGNSKIEERMMLQATVSRDEKVIAVFHALNDIVMGKSFISRITQFKLSINQTPLGTVMGDGLIVATPTGSTGYSLSAGGPILRPSLHAMIVNPICPHSLTIRPLVISDKEAVQIQWQTKGHPDILTVDGQQICDILFGDDIEIKRSPYQFRMVNPEKRTFYEILQSKFNWNEL